MVSEPNISKKCGKMFHISWWSMGVNMRKTSCLEGGENIIPQRMPHSKR